VIEFTPLKRLVMVTLIVIAFFCLTAKADDQVEKEKTVSGPTVSQVKEKADSVLSSPEVTRSIVAQDWETLVNLLSRDSTYSADARVWLLIGHAHIARN